MGPLVFALTFANSTMSLPNAEELIDELSGSRWFSTLDLASCCWQVELDPIDREKTAFTFHGKGLFHFKVMCFGLTNAPATFQRLMESVLKGILWKICVVYMDDVICYADKFQTAYNNLKIVFQRLREAGFRLKPKKMQIVFSLNYIFRSCSFRRRSVTRSRKDGSSTNMASSSECYGLAKFFRFFFLL